MIYRMDLKRNSVVYLWMFLAGNFRLCDQLSIYNGLQSKRGGSFLLNTPDIMRVGSQSFPIKCTHCESTLTIVK